MIRNLRNLVLQRSSAEQQVIITNWFKREEPTPHIFSHPFVFARGGGGGLAKRAGKRLALGNSSFTQGVA